MTRKYVADARRILGVCALAVGLSGCVGTYGQFVADSVFDPPSLTRVNGSSGENLEIYSIDTAPTPQRAIFFVSGSGCASLRYFLRSYFSNIGGSYRIYAVQKPAVSATETGFSCSRKFQDRYTYPELQARNRDAFHWVRSQWPGKVTAVVGVSEGGTLAAELAADDPDIGKLVVIGSGGMKFRHLASIVAQRRNKMDEMRAALARIDANPDDTRSTVLGMTPRYWTSVLDVDPLAVYRRVSQPILLIIGEQDENVPVESALHLKEIFAHEGRRNLTLEIVPGADHVLKRNGSDLKPDLMRRIGNWLSTGAWSA